MHSQNGQQQPSMGKQINGAINMLVSVSQFISYIGEAFMRLPGTWGSRHAVGLHMGVSWVILYLWSALFFPASDPWPMRYLWLGATALLLLHAIAGRYKRWKGYKVHSMYTGRSIFSQLGISESWAKSACEPFAFACLGALADHLSHPMAVYLLTVGVCTWIANSYLDQAQQAQFQANEDAWHDGRVMQAEMQRRMEG